MYRPLTCSVQKTDARATGSGYWLPFLNSGGKYWPAKSPMSLRWAKRQKCSHQLDSPLITRTIYLRQCGGSDAWMWSFIFASVSNSASSIVALTFLVTIGFHLYEKACSFLPPLNISTALANLSLLFQSSTLTIIPFLKSSPKCKERLSMVVIVNNDWTPVPPSLCIDLWGLSPSYGMIIKIIIAVAYMPGTPLSPFQV